MRGLAAHNVCQSPHILHQTSALSLQTSYIIPMHDVVPSAVSAAVKMDITI